MALKYSVEIAPTGYRVLKGIRNRKTAREIARAIDRLGSDPIGQGKALLPPFAGVHSVRACRGRYRILYAIQEDSRIVSVVYLGLRKPGAADDVYALARELLGLEDSGEK